MIVLNGSKNHLPKTNKITQIAKKKQCFGAAILYKP